MASTVSPESLFSCCEHCFGSLAEVALRQWRHISPSQAAPPRTGVSAPLHPQRPPGAWRQSSQGKARKRRRRKSLISRRAAGCGRTTRPPRPKRNSTPRSSGPRSENALLLRVLTSQLLHFRHRGTSTQAVLHHATLIPASWKLSLPSSVYCIDVPLSPQSI